MRFCKRVRRSSGLLIVMHTNFPPYNIAAPLRLLMNKVSL
jgi:hypothetical protein